tara:strand:+ start:327 stop:671 length:345 start_codon:yes stop_codon:yes gene_type:complete
MDEITKIRNELAAYFRSGELGYNPGPVLDKDGKDMSRPMYGKKHTTESRKQMSKAHMGNSYKKGKKVKDTSNMKKPDVHKGKGNPNWKGGISGKPGSDKRKEYMKKYNKEYFGY